MREEAEAARAALAAAHSEIERLTARLTSTRNELEAALAARRKDADETMQLKAALSAAEQGAPLADATAASSIACCARASARATRSS